ncbi:MAG TPA: class I SAM-dependent methyltransferase [Rhodospirillales bacterium]|nr:class I SAM-dependent methyltransferase [Rhodospirillales bacterium]
MSLYRDHLLPRLIHGVMRDPRFLPLRRALVAEARGRVLEIGIGSGPNLPLYDPARVETVVGIDPNAVLLRLARRRGAERPFPVWLVRATAERLPFADASMDSVLSSWTLCSIPDLDTALAEIRRVLRPGGRFLFVEHGLAREPGVARWQRRLTPLWRPLAGGCHLDRPIGERVAAAGFRTAELETGYLLAGPRLFTYHYRGAAEPAPSPGGAERSAGADRTPCRRGDAACGK